MVRRAFLTSHSIPYGHLRTLFFDVGNTLVSFDLELVKTELARHEIVCDVQDLRRAEAAARPTVSASLSSERTTETLSTFELYLHVMLLNLPTQPVHNESSLARVAHDLVQAFDAIGRVRLWSNLLPQVPETLEALKNRGLQLVVVSNSDGTVEELIAAVNLRDLFDSVIDSRIVGYEKPDPRIFEHALNVSGASPETTLHVGDLYHADVVGARAAGIHALLLDPYGDWINVDCELVPDMSALLQRFPKP